MAKRSEKIIFTATPEQAEKLRELARGEGLTVSTLCQRLVDLVPTKKVVLNARVFNRAVDFQSAETVQQ